jgi:hypothetical protein
MSKSLIRKNQLHPDISDLVGQYGSGFFVTSGQVSGISAGTSQSSLAFNGNRNITRTSFPNNINVGGSTVIEFLNNVFFPPPPFVPATINLTNPYPDLREYGKSTDTINSVNFNGSITANSSTGIKNLIYRVNGTQQGSTVPSPSTTFNSVVSALNINDTSSISVEITCDIDVNGNTSLINNTQTINFVKPYYWGYALTQGATPITIRTVANLAGNQQFSKGLSSYPSSLTLTFSPGSLSSDPGAYMYFAYPSEWNNLSSAIGSNYDLLPNFTLSQITDTGWLQNNTSWTYKKYVYNLQSTATDYSITFNF